jgi:hypothetical protein
MKNIIDSNIRSLYNINEKFHVDGNPKANI